MLLDQTTAREFARRLSEVLPTVIALRGCTVVVKYGGNAMTDETLKSGFARDVVSLWSLGAHPVIVHGGGPQIGRGLAALGKPSEFVAGMRVTDKASVEVVDRVLGSEVNREIVELVEAEGARAVGINGRDGLVSATKLRLGGEHEDVDLGFVGEVAAIDTSAIDTALKMGQIPVIAPLGRGGDGMIYNINADLVAGRIAQAMTADVLVLLTNAPGMLDANGELMPRLAVDTVGELVDTGVIHGGMLPKIQCALDAAADGVKNVKIADGRVAQCLMLEVLTAAGHGDHRGRTRVDDGQAIQKGSDSPGTGSRTRDESGIEDHHGPTRDRRGRIGGGVVSAFSQQGEDVRGAHRLRGRVCFRTDQSHCQRGKQLSYSLGESEYGGAHLRGAKSRYYEDLDRRCSGRRKRPATS